MKNTVKISLCQLNFHVGNLKNNLEKILAAREEVKKQGGNLCIFSELSITGYPPEDLVLRKTFIQSAEKIVEKLIDISKDFSKVYPPLLEVDFTLIVYSFSLS